MSFFNPLDRNTQSAWITESNGGSVNVSVVWKETSKDGSFSQCVNVKESRRGQKTVEMEYLTYCNSKGQCDVMATKRSR